MPRKTRTRSSPVGPIVFFFFVGFSDEGVVASRLSSSCTQKRVTSANSSGHSEVTLAAQVSPEALLFLYQKDLADMLNGLLRNVTAGACFSIPLFYRAATSPLLSRLDPLQIIHQSWLLQRNQSHHFKGLLQTLKHRHRCLPKKHHRFQILKHWRNVESWDIGDVLFHPSVGPPTIADPHDVQTWVDWRHRSDPSVLPSEHQSVSWFGSRTAAHALIWGMVLSSPPLSCTPDRPADRQNSVQNLFFSRLEHSKKRSLTWPKIPDFCASHTPILSEHSELARPSISNFTDSPRRLLLWRNCELSRNLLWKRHLHHLLGESLLHSFFWDQPQTRPFVRSTNTTWITTTISSLICGTGTWGVSSTAARVFHTLAHIAARPPLLCRYGHGGRQQHRDDNASPRWLAQRRPGQSGRTVIVSRTHTRFATFLWHILCNENYLYIRTALTRNIQHQHHADYTCMWTSMNPCTWSLSSRSGWCFKFLLFQWYFHHRLVGSVCTNAASSTPQSVIPRWCGAPSPEVSQLWTRDDVAWPSVPLSGL